MREGFLCFVRLPFLESGLRSRLSDGPQWAGARCCLKPPAQGLRRGGIDQQVVGMKRANLECVGCWVPQVMRYAIVLHCGDLPPVGRENFSTLQQEEIIEMPLDRYRFQVSVQLGCHRVQRGKSIVACLAGFTGQGLRFLDRLALEGVNDHGHVAQRLDLVAVDVHCLLLLVLGLNSSSGLGGRHARSPGETSLEIASPLDGCPSFEGLLSGGFRRPA